MTQDLIRALNERGYRAGVVKIERLGELRKEIETRYAEGSFDDRFYRNRLSGFVYTPQEDSLQAKSIIVIAAAQPHFRFVFESDGERIPVIVPATYLHWGRTEEQFYDVLSNALSVHGYRVTRATLPKKLLAVRSGLSEYGRNNITYVAGLGSYYWLSAFYSDLPCEQDEWREPRMMERCEDCVACVNVCPTGAISPGRFLLRAERCIAYFSEEPTDVPFPDWFEPGLYECLVGCMYCQRICPENKEITEWIEDGAEFTADETNLLLDGTAPEHLPDRTVNKLNGSDLIAYYYALPRNLKVLLERTER
jgi:epoxyqueuosine reductase